MTTIETNATRVRRLHAYADAASVSRAVRWSRVARVALVLLTLAGIGLTWHVRYSIAATTPWQCDEIPLLLKFTGVCGHVTNEREAQAFVPSLYTASTGAIRSLKAPRVFASLHTTAGFWTNLTIHLFGVNPLGGRIAPLFWSLVAVVGVGVGAFLVRRSVVAVCIAALVVALSPHAIAHGALARGYAEALALAPLLLIALELYRRRADSWLRAVLVFVCALQLSLTIYTLWIYWVMPTIVVSLFLPRLIRDESSRRGARVTLIAIAVGVVSCMGIFTIDRWDHLTYHAFVSSADLTFDDLGAVFGFLQLLIVRLMPAPTWMSLAAIVGVVVVWRSPVRWWLAVIGCGVAVPTLLAMANGSAGYTRTFGYLVGPIAILYGVGADAIWRHFAKRHRPMPVTIVALGVLLGTWSWAYAGVEDRARAIMLPDWGEVVMALDRTPETVGPRWLCCDRANHWQLDWYRSARESDVYMRVPPGDTIEVVMGAQHDDQGRPIVFRKEPLSGAVLQDPLPAYLATTSPTRVQAGIELRQWVGRRHMDRPEHPNAESPWLVLIGGTAPISRNTFLEFLIDMDARARGLVTFPALHDRKGYIISMIIPGSTISDLALSIKDALGIRPEQIHWFELLPWSDRQTMKERGLDSARESRLASSAIRWPLVAEVGTPVRPAARTGKYKVAATTGGSVTPIGARTIPVAGQQGGRLPWKH